MTTLTVETRFAHSEGPCLIAHSRDGSFVATAGRDGEVRTFKSFDASSEDSSFLVGEECLALAVGKSKLYASSSGLMSVKAYDYDSHNEMEVVTCAGDVTALDISKDDSLLAVGSEDREIRLVDTHSFKWTRAEGHEGALLSVALDPLKSFVLSSAIDGSMRLWSIESDMKMILQRVWPQIFPSINAPKPCILAKMSWNPKGGSHFVAPCKKHLKVFQRGSWFEETSLTSSQLEADEIFGCVSWSSTNMTIAVGTSGGNVFVFDINLRQLLSVIKSNRKFSVSDISWNPVKAEVVFVDVNGFWAQANLQVEEERSESKSGVQDKHSETAADDDEMRDLDEEELANLLQDDDDDGDDDDDDENSFSIRKIKREVGLQSDNDDSNISSTMTSSKKTLMDSNDKSVETTKNVREKGDVGDSRGNSPTPTVYIQEPFQSSSTPVHLSSRFMCYNSVGVVMSFRNEDEGTIDVEFHDTSTHHAIHLNNNSMYTLADLSTKALVLASSRSHEDEDLEGTYKLLCHSLVSKEWSLELSNEMPLALCCGQSFVALATDTRVLRIFSLGGLQREVIALPGTIIALAAHEAKLLVTVHNGLPLDGDQNIAFAVFDECGSNAVLSHKFMSLPLTPQSKLQWLGFSDEGNAITQDSSDVIRVWNKHYWTQIANLSKNVKSKNDHYFMVGLSVTELTIRAILCKGSTYPSLLPKPTLSLLRMNAPLCEAVTERGFAESKLWLSSLQSQLCSGENDIQKEQDELMLQLFALYCKSEMESRATDLGRLMSLDSLQTSIRFASKMGKRLLASSLSAMATVRCEQLAPNKYAEERQRESSSVLREESIDLFSNCDDNDNDQLDNESEVGSSNPFLKVKRKRYNEESGNDKSYFGGSNPFKVAKLRKSQSDKAKNPLRTGLTIDSMQTTCASGRKKGGREFGDTNFDKLQKQSNASLAKEKQTKLVLGSNKPSVLEQQGSKELKGFQLWLAENKSSFSGGDNGSATNMKGLEVSNLNTAMLQQIQITLAYVLKMWRSMSKAEKDMYSTPRLPKVNQLASNNEDEENNDHLRTYYG